MEASCFHRYTRSKKIVLLYFFTWKYFLRKMKSRSNNNNDKKNNPNLITQTKAKSPLTAKQLKIKLKTSNLYCKRLSLPLLLFFVRFYLFIFRERGRDRERGREISMCGCLSCALHWGPDLQPRLVPWLGIRLVTLWFTDPHSIHWATAAKVNLMNFNISIQYKMCFKTDAISFRSHSL